MSYLAGRKHREAGPGFTLVELLLTTALVLLLLGAAVFSFTTLQRGRELEEGAAQVEALLRFARAQAALTGRQVQINFEEEVAEGWSLSLGGVRVLWELDPVGDPGTFSEMPEAAAFVRGITELVEVTNVRWFDANSDGQDGGGERSHLIEGESDLLAEEVADVFPPITFYPDGSGDSAEIMLSSRSPDDPRRVAVRIMGLTGTIRREFVLPESEEVGSETETADLEHGSAGSASAERPRSPAESTAPARSE